MTNSVAAPRFDEAEAHSLETLPQFLRRNAQQFAAVTAYRERTGGATGWSETPWADVYARVTRLAAGLIELTGGSGRAGDMPVGYVIGPNGPEFFMGEYAVQAMGATAFPLFERMTSAEMRATLPTFHALVAFSGSADASRRLLDSASDLGLAHIVQWGSEPLPLDQRVISIEELEELGRARLAREPWAVEDIVDRGSLDDIACVLLTSGTTGTSKGVLASYRYLLDIAARYRHVYRADRSDRYLSYLPAPFTPEQYAGLTLAAALPLQVAFPASASSVEEDFVASESTMRYLGPRQWEELRATLPSDLLNDQQRITAEKATIRRDLGLEHVKAGVTAGGSLSGDVVSFFRMIDLPISNVYGFAEVGIITAAGLDDPSDSVGFALPSAYGPPIHLRISPDGEVQLQGGVWCSGYWGAQHQLKVTDDGWLRSGDAGEMPGGALRILDRLDHIQTLPSGAAFAPQPVEITIMQSPYIANVVLIGGLGSDSRIGALVQVNEAAVRRDLELPDHATYEDVVLDARTTPLIERELATANAALPPSQRVGLLGLMPKPLTPDDGELTRSMKLRRGEVVRRYDQLINAMYASEQSASSKVTFTALVGRETDATLSTFTTRVSSLADVEGQE